MTPDRAVQLEQLFLAALSQGPGERAGFVSRCKDEALRAALQNLLREFDKLGSFLDEPPIHLVVDETRTLTHDMLVPGQVLRERYRIVRLVGRGGMGEVYEAEDLELNSRVAVKTLRAGLPSAGRALERFKLEIVLGRRVTHQNVCRLFDIDRATVGDGEVMFLTMEFLEGETLSHRLKTGGPMSITAATPIIGDMIAGLAACHRHGIIHRDFKSPNVMLVCDGEGDPHAILTDFGLAHTIRSESPERVALSIAGGIMGTPEYMAPEQKEGKPATEASDIYALGIVLCEMLTGHRPAGPPGLPSLPAGRPQLDSACEAAILRCIQTDPADRFSGVAEVGEALALAHTSTAKGQEKDTWRQPRAASPRRRILAAVLVLLAILSAWLAYRRFHALPDLKHVAILPFQDLGNNPTDQVFCEGLSETLTSKLSQLERYQKSFWVVPASESRHVSDPHEAFRKLDATLVVSGSLQRLPGKTVLVINVIDPRTRRQLASRNIDTLAADLSGLEEEAWQRVTDLLDLQLRPEEVRSLEAGRARVPSAYVAYAQGLGYLRRNGIENINNAIAQFKVAVERDSSYALPYSGLGSAYALKYEVTQDTQWLGPAQANAKRAVELAPELAQVHFALGQIDVSTGRAEDAAHELNRALDLDPDVIEAHFYLGRLHAGEGKLEDAARDFRSAVARRPEYWRTHSELGTFFFKHGHFSEAELEFAEALKLQPDDSGTLTNLGAIYLTTGRFEEAIRVLENEVRVKTDDGNAYSNLGTAYMFLGRYAEAVAPMEKAVDLNPNSVDVRRNLGDAYQMAPGKAGKAAGAYRDALALGRRQLAINPDDPETMVNVALFEAHLNSRPEALRFAEQAVKKAPSNSDVLFTCALVYEILQLRAAALRFLSAAYEKGFSLTDIEREPILAALRKDPRYQTWIMRVRIALTQGKK